MHFTTFVSTEQDLAACKETGLLQEVLIGPAEFCREGRIDFAQAQQLAALAIAADLRPVLVWDVLLPESEMRSAISLLKEQGLARFAAIRVQDVGALQFLLEEYPSLPVQFIAETANANLHALQRWQDSIGERLDRLILSTQLPEECVVQYCEALTAPLEVLGAGPILLFYSPRPLLTPKIDPASEAGEYLLALSSSEESHNRPFPTVQNRHGTFMYLNKDQFLLDMLKNVEAAGLASVRIDLRQVSSEPHSADGIVDLLAAYKAGACNAKQHWPNPAFAPFFRRNKTTKQFDKLKPEILQKRDERVVARVLMGNKPKQMVLWAARDFNTQAQFDLLLPNGTLLPCGALEFANLDGEPVQEAREDQLLIAPWVKRCCVGALLFEVLGK